jgi:SulP family sulfate permease
MNVASLARYAPILKWGRTYDRNALTGDLLAAVIVTIMLIPQSLAYALLAGLPPEAGLYASIAPIILYAIFGTSRALAVGPVAVVSLMTAAAIWKYRRPRHHGYAVAALTLAALSGAILLVMGLLKLGFLTNFLSHPVIAGFITASGILIATSQIKHILAISADGDTLPEMVISLAPPSVWAYPRAGTSSGGPVRPSYRIFSPVIASSVCARFGRKTRRLLRILIAI